MTFTPAIVKSILAGVFYALKKKEKWLKEGRGQGELADYKPWIKISDISSSFTLRFRTIVNP